MIDNEPRAALARERNPPPSTDMRWGNTSIEMSHRAQMPTQIYPLFENALRAARGRSVAGQREFLGRDFSVRQLALDFGEFGGEEALREAAGEEGDEADPDQAEYHAGNGPERGAPTPRLA